MSKHNRKNMKQYPSPTNKVVPRMMNIKGWITRLLIRNIKAPIRVFRLSKIITGILYHIEIVTKATANFLPRTVTMKFLVLYLKRLSIIFCTNYKMKGLPDFLFKIII